MATHEVGELSPRGMPVALGSVDKILNWGEVTLFGPLLMGLHVVLLR